MNASNLMHVKETAQALNISEGTLYRMARAGDLPAFRIGKRWLFDVDAVLRLMSSARALSVTRAAPRPAPRPRPPLAVVDGQADLGRAIDQAALALRQVTRLMGYAPGPDRGNS